VGYWGVLGVLGSNSGYWWILWGTAGTGGTKEYLGVLWGYCRYCVVLWETGGGVTAGTGCTGWCWGSKNSTVGYCMVLLGTTGYLVVLGCTGGALVGTEGTGGLWGYSVVPEGALENYWVLGLLGRTGGYMGGTGKY